MNVWLPLVRTGTGAEVYTRRLAVKLAELGHRVTLDELAHHFQYYPWLAPIRPPKEADVIVANSWNAAGFRHPGVPLVTVVHHVVHDPAQTQHKSISQRTFHRAFVKPIESYAIRNSECVVSVSRTTEMAIKKFIADVPVSVVLNGVDTDFFTPNDQGSRAAAGTPIRLLFVGKPSRRKGFDLVTRIIEELGNDAVLTCVGPAPSERLLRAKGRYLGFVSREALRDAYREADLLLFPSRLEGFGFAAAEALACGVPVVSVRGTAVEEIAPPPVCGIACEAGSIADFVAAIRDISADRARLQSMREAARNHAVEHLTERRWISEMESLLERVVRRAAAVPGTVT